MDVIGHWHQLGTPASVDWCEPNCVHSVYVAEWWNTLSSLPIAVLGVVALVWALRRPFRADPRFIIGGLALTIVGLGSAAFHGTLLRLPQAADELPMIYSGLTFLYVVRWRKQDSAPGRRRWQAGLLLYAAGFTAAYFAFPSYFTFFILTYAAAVTLVVVQTARVSFGAASDTRRRRLFLLSAGSYVGGVLLLWVPEHLVLACDHPLQAFHLHAWFHLTSAVGSYAWLLWAVYDRQAVLGQPMRSVFPVPRCEE